MLVRLQKSASMIFKGLKMTRFNDSDRRATSRGRDRDVSMSLGSAVRRQACVVALGALLGFFGGNGVEAAQNRSIAQIFPPQNQQQFPQAPRAQQFQAAQAQAQAQANRTQNRQSSRSPILSGILGQNKQASSGASGQFNQLNQLNQPTPHILPRTAQPSQEPEHLGVFGTRPIFSGSKNLDRAERQARERQSQEFHERSQHLNAPGQNAGQPIMVQGAGRRPDGSYPQSVAPGDLTQASTNPAEANEALARVPWNLFPEKTKARFQQVAASPTMYRRLPMAGGRCNPELFDFFLTYPNTIVELWKQMGYEEVDMKQVDSATYAVSEKDGSSGKLTILYQNAELAVAHVVGTYRGAGMIRPVEGEAFLILQVRYTEDQALTPLVVCRLDAFVNIKNPGVDLVARAFNSMIGKIADANFEQTLAFVDSVSQTVEQDPRQFQQVVAQLGGLSPQARRLLADKATTVAMQAQARESGKPVNYRLLAKANDPNPGYARILARGANQTPARNSSLAANGPKPSFQGYRAPDVEDDFFDDNDMNASFAESGVHVGNNSSIKSFGQTRELHLGIGDDFSLASDDSSDYGFETDDEVMMTGEEYLATQSLSSPNSGSAMNSLAKIGPAPSKNARALELVEEESESFATLADSPSAISTDEELVVDSFEFDDEEESPAPRALPLTRLPGTPKLPSTVRGLNASNARPGALNAAPLVSADEEEQYSEVAEISLDEDGNPILEFTDEEEGESDSESDAENAPEIPAVTLEDDPETLTLPDPATLDGEDGQETIDEEEEDEESEEDAFEAGGWTRSALANRRVSEKIAKQANGASTKSDGEEPIAERPRLTTKRYVPPLEKSNGVAAVKTMDEAKSADSGERVATYRWSPVPGAFVAKTAALPREENTLSPKTAKFAKPEIR